MAKKSSCVEMWQNNHYEHFMDSVACLNSLCEYTYLVNKAHSDYWLQHEGNFGTYFLHYGQKARKRGE